MLNEFAKAVDMVGVRPRLVASAAVVVIIGVGAATNTDVVVGDCKSVAVDVSVVFISSGLRLIVILLPAPEYSTEYMAAPFETVLIAGDFNKFGLVISVIVSPLWGIDDDTDTIQLALEIIGAWLTVLINVGVSILAGVPIVGDGDGIVAIATRVTFVVDVSGVDGVVTVDTV